MKDQSNINISQENINRFSQWSHDANPLHLDPDFSRQTLFGKPIVHSVLAVIESLLETGLKIETPITGLEAEFRRPMYPGRNYHAQVKQEDTSLLVTTGDGHGTCLISRLLYGDSIDLKDLETEGLSTLNKIDNNKKEKIRKEAADRDIESFHRGMSINGFYATDTPPEHYTSGSHLTQAMVRVLGLTSYLVGMEIPGLHSLFTRIRLNFILPDSFSDAFVYNVKITQCNPQFRTLHTTLEVLTPEGDLVATGELRSYVRFSPLVTDVAYLKKLVEQSGNRFKDKVALVCGGSRGLGANITALLALSGCHVYASHLSDSKELNDLSDNLLNNNVNVTFIKGDAGDAAWCQKALTQISDKHKRLDILILNACAPPEPMGITTSAASGFVDYVSKNLLLAQQPLSVFLPTINKSDGLVVGISSSFVVDLPKDFTHYAALKQAVESTIHSLAKDFPHASFLIPRPPRILTSWNDTPAGIIGAISVEQAAFGIMKEMAKIPQPGHVSLISDFPELPVDDMVSDPGPAEMTLVVAASFTSEPLIPGLRFWFKELGHHVDIELAPYGQVLQELINPVSSLSANKNGVSVVFLRLRDWFRELPEEEIASEDSVESYLKKTAKEFINAVRTHRSHTSVETLLVLCPSTIEPVDNLQMLIDKTESEMLESLKRFSGLQSIRAVDFHSLYGVTANKINDPLREKIAHMPYQNSYFNILATLVIRSIQRRWIPLRKVVIVDCDNTLWDGVVGEIGAEGLVFNDAQQELHSLLIKLSNSGIVICLCSKNEPFDVWSVFDNREDFKLKRNQIVAAMINWKPKSENIRQLATKLNLGMDSFIFIDDNPVECAEVRAACPQVLTLQWPHDSQKAQQLLQHTWELDIKTGTGEDSKRAKMYREEFKRQEFLDETLSFSDFIKSLHLEVDLRPLNDEDLARASQLTMRTNQFNFTTIRRKESELKPLMSDDSYECRTIRVHDRFGDYGLVGLFIARVEGNLVELDTFLLSCRVLGRGVEYHLMTELGRIALANQARIVKMHVDPTSRNTPAREFLKAISPDEFSKMDESGRFECEIPSEYLAELSFQTEKDSKEQPEDVEKVEGKADKKSETDQTFMPSRLSQIEKAAYKLSTFEALTAAIDGSSGKEHVVFTAASSIKEPEEVGVFVYDVFAAELDLTVKEIKEIDQLEPLGCDSLKIVEITVTLVEQFPWLPITLLFEHRSVSDIIDHITHLIKTGEWETAQIAGPAIAVDKKSLKDGVTDIAIIGMDIRCAGADSPEELWEMLSEGKTGIRPVSASREFFINTFNDDRPHWAGLMDKVDGFDAGFFGVAPREAELMDPQVRLFLEVAWGALEDACCAGTIRGTDMGVYVGKMYDDYVFTANVIANITKNAYRSWEGFSMANRLSHFLNLRGPSFTVNTACSSSGTALHLACRAISDGECRTALVGGSNLILDSHRFGQLGRLGILSASGKCRPFGDKADGTLLGEGIGAVVLKPLDDAVNDGDRIYGVIKGTALSTGTGTVGFTVPNPNAQALAISRSLNNAGIDPRTISYVEAHGTGTQLGDPIEIRGLMMAYSDKQLWDSNLSGMQHCRVGSIKPNTGHLESGAGIIGLIKILLQFKYNTLLPTITSEESNPQIPFNLGPFSVQKKLESWDQPAMIEKGDPVKIPRRAGLSSFGVGGANAHIILEESPVINNSERNKPVESDTLPPCHVLTLSGRHDDVLKDQVINLRKYVNVQPDLRVEDICYTTNVGREHFKHRMAMLVSEKNQMVEAMDAFIDGSTAIDCYTGTVSRTGSLPKTAFLFTGQGAQYAGMGRELYDVYPVFKNAVDGCIDILDTLIDKSFLKLLFAPVESEHAQLLNQTGYTQPALFVIEYALSELWKSWGVQPSFVMGHSVGEIVALTVAGVLTVEDGLRLITARGKLMQELPSGGKMAAVRADEAMVQSELNDIDSIVSIAAINGPQAVVISGDGKAVDEIVERFKNKGIDATMLNVSHAFHSQLMEPMLSDYEKVYQNVSLSQPVIPVVSCVDGNIFDPGANMSDYWARQVRQAVRFYDAMAFLDKQGATVYLEAGPHPVLLGMGSLCLPYDDRVWLPSLRRNAQGTSTTIASLAKLYTLGWPVDWESFNKQGNVKKIGLPTYPFRHRKYWIDRTQLAELTKIGTVDVHKYSNCIYNIQWQEKQLQSECETGQINGGKWLIFADRNSLSDSLAKALAEKASETIMVYHGEKFSQDDRGSFRLNSASYDDFEHLWRVVTSNGETVQGIIHLWSLDIPGNSNLTTDALAAYRQVILNSALYLSQAVLRSNNSKDARIWFVTPDTAAIQKDKAQTNGSLIHMPLWGFGRVLALEHPEIWGGLIDISSGEIGLKETAESLVSEILSSDDEDQVAVRQSGRFVARLQRYELEFGEELSIDPKGVYLVTGASGALGIRLAKWLSDKGAKHLILTSRSGLKDPAVGDILAELKEKGVLVETLSVNVASVKDMENLKKHICSKENSLKGVIHLAGIDNQIPILDLNEQLMQEVLAPKMEGGWLLHELTSGMTLDFFVLFSSIASVLGSDGRAHYAAANAFLDGLACHRQQMGLPATAINWGPWKAGGMATEEDIDYYNRMGNHGLEPDAAIFAMEQIINGKNIQTVLVDIDWARFKTVYNARKKRPFIELLDSAQEEMGMEEEKSVSAWKKQLQETPVEDRSHVLSNLVQKEIAQMLGFDDPEDVSNDLDFMEMGMDSLRSVEVSLQIKKQLGLEQSIILYDFPNIMALAESMLDQLSLDGVSKKTKQSGGTEKIIDYSSDVESDVLDFYRNAWPDRLTDTMESRWRWMFIRSAERLAIKPRMWIYREANSVVGFTGAIPVNVKIADREIQTAWCVDTMVLESCRHMGLGPHIMVKVKEDLPFNLSLGQTKEMRLILERLGWQQVAPFQTYIYPIRPQRILQGKLNTLLAGSLGTGLQVRQLARRLRLKSRMREPELNVIERFDYQHDRLWQSVKKDYACAVVRDASYLNWKYVHQPGQDFILLEIHEKDKVVAIAVLMVKEPGSNSPYLYRRAFIVDVVVPASDTSLVLGVLEKVRQHCVSLDVDSIVFELINEKIEKILESYGFIKREPTRFFWICPDGEQNLTKTVLSSGNWLITKGDSDIDRPGVY